MSLFNGREDGDYYNSEQDALVDIGESAFKTWFALRMDKRRRRLDNKDRDLEYKRKTNYERLRDKWRSDMKMDAFEKEMQIRQGYGSTGLVYKSGPKKGMHVTYKALKNMPESEQSNLVPSNEFASVQKLEFAEKYGDRARKVDTANARSGMALEREKSLGMLLLNEALRRELGVSSKKGGDNRPSFTEASTLDKRFEEKWENMLQGGRQELINKYKGEKDLNLIKQAEKRIFLDEMNTLVNGYQQEISRLPSGTTEKVQKYLAEGNIGEAIDLLALAKDAPSESDKESRFTPSHKRSFIAEYGSSDRKQQRLMLDKLKKEDPTAYKEVSKEIGEPVGRESASEEGGFLDGLLNMFKSPFQDETTSDGSTSFRRGRNDTGDEYVSQSLFDDEMSTQDGLEDYSNRGRNRTSQDYEEEEPSRVDYGSLGYLAGEIGQSLFS